jgi:flavodoxin I
MNILIIYATYSGSTGEAIQLVSGELTKAGHTVTVKTPTETTVQNCMPSEFLILASPSWDYEGKEGQPHEDFQTFFKTLDQTQFLGKPYAVLGLGDTAYPHYCGAVDIFEEFMNTRGAKKAAESLRIDKYFSSHDNPQKVTTWASQLLKG